MRDLHKSIESPKNMHDFDCIFDGNIAISLYSKMYLSTLDLKFYISKKQNGDIF